MNSYSFEKEIALFHDIAAGVMELTKKSLATNTVVKNKGSSTNYTTELDVASEQLIVGKILEVFPGDTILAEEESSETEIGEGRLWIIDPICGTNNLGRDISMYCSNIALAVDGKLVASCVVDLSQYKYYWSIGNEEIFCGYERFARSEKELGTTIDSEFTAAISCDRETRIRHARAISEISIAGDIAIISFGSSLSFLYLAIGKLEGILNPGVNAWDVAAGAFLIMQSGALITEADGSPWSVVSNNFIAARTPELHARLLVAYNH